MSLSDTATALLARNGEAVVISYTNAEVRNPATGEITTPGTTVTLNGYGYPSRYRAHEIDGTVVKHSDTKLILSKISTRPESGWLAFVQSKSFRIMDVQPITKAGADIIYICQLRV